MKNRPDSNIGTFFLPRNPIICLTLTKFEYTLTLQKNH